VVLNERSRIITPTGIQGIPHLVVEILADSTIDNDRVLKQELYERAGIPEYWIVDPQEHKVDQFVRDAARYVHRGSFEDRVEAATIPNVILELDQVW